jgi:EAL domain-containing protein (putative c-di-GMP-specific phosphodiesterase class I)
VLELETDLRRAVDNEEFELHYQPIVSLETGVLQGYESLIRWRHPVRGLLAPAEFLEVAEETGLIVPMGWWTLREAALQAKRWWDPDRQGPYVAVNLSATQLSQPDLVDRLRTILVETGVSPSALRLELTENVVMQQAEATSRTLVRLRDLGVSLMIDDFGMGYSSLSYLHRFAADTLKIDSSFIADIGPNCENSEIVRTIVALADELGMDVVAEGVETMDQFRAVRALGCESAQGYHLARPAPAEDVDASVRFVWELP